MRRSQWRNANWNTFDEHFLHDSTSGVVLQNDGNDDHDHDHDEPSKEKEEDKPSDSEHEPGGGRE